MSEAFQIIPREPRFPRERFDAIKSKGEVYITKGLIPRHGVGHLTGPSGSYKTFLALEWAMRIAQGLPILEHKTKGCGVIYVAAEAPNGVRRRVEAWRKRNPDRRGLPFELIGNAPDLRDADNVDDLLAELRIATAEMERTGTRLGLIVVDTLATCIPGADESNAVDMSTVLASLQRVAAELEAFVMVVSHTGKDEGRGIRGWSGQQANADMVVFLSRAEKSPTSVGRVAKLKDGEDGEEFAFGLDKVQLGFDEDGDEIGSCVVAYQDVPVDSGTNKRKKTLSAGAQTALGALHRLDEAGQLQSVPLVPGVKLGTKGARLDALRQKTYDLGLTRAAEPASDATDVERKRWMDSRKKAFQRALDQLVEAEKVRHEADWVWEL